VKRAYYSDTIDSFLATENRAILGDLSTSSEGAVEELQRVAWVEQIKMLKAVLANFDGKIYLEYAIPRMGRRIDAVILIGSVVFVVEFKIGATEYHANAVDQVWDYALDLRNFHSNSHDVTIAPILVAPQAIREDPVVATTQRDNKMLLPICANGSNFKNVLSRVLDFSDGPSFDPVEWEQGNYHPTPTIIEAALALYRGHSVKEISRSDAGAKNLHETMDAISNVITMARQNSRKAICFVTGVPGAGKTLVGLNIATKHLQEDKDSLSVFLSGNGPLVAVLQEALARDLVVRAKGNGKRISKKEAHSRVKAFVQNVHHYRDEALRDQRPPADHVALFDEAQRAWHERKTSDFMARKKGVPDFGKSEPEFLISCIDRHRDWGVVICLVGGGQEIHTGEAGIGEWINALIRSFSSWHIHISSKLVDSEYEAGDVLRRIAGRANVEYHDDLHLSVSMRSFRAETVSLLIKQMLDRDIAAANETRRGLSIKYPIVITRDLGKAKKWLRENARGSERYGMVVSSQAERLKPHAIDIKSPINPIHWFLDGKEDVRSSYYLEDVATEFSVQGLELDWTCVVWDADFRYSEKGWLHRSFCGSTWQKINKTERQNYLKNAYRVLLTRARQGMVIVVPPGDANDPTRLPEFYDSTYAFLRGIGFDEL
jgi:hypothetical protein